MKPFLQSVKSSKIKVLVLAVCLGAVPQLALAEANESVSSPRAEQWKIVPTLGYSYFNIQGASAAYKSKSGSSAAVLAQMPMMGGQIELESGLEYLETGAKQTLDFGFFSIDAMTIDIKQIAVPLRAKYIFNPETTSTRWYGKAGLTPTYVVGAKAEVPGASSDIKSDLNDIGVLTQVGLGADWGIDAVTGRVSLDLTYSYGLTKVFKNSDGRATGFQVQAGYAFAL